MTGDPQQCLPVVPKGTKIDQLYSSVKASTLWKHVKSYHLTKNVRVQLTGDPEAELFENVLLKIGKGRLGESGYIQVPPQVTVKTKQEMIDSIFPGLELNYKSHAYLSKRAILAPKNVRVDSLNEDLLKKIPGEEKTYFSRDFPIQSKDSTKYPIEVLNKINFPGVPPHKLVLKKGAPIILMRNIDPPMMVNGTRMVISSWAAFHSKRTGGGSLWTNGADCEAGSQLSETSTMSIGGWTLLITETVKD